MKYYWLPCSIENTGFSSERRYECELPEGAGRIVGTAYVEYLRDAQENELTDEMPSYGQSISGFVQCRVRDKGDRVILEFPGSDVFHVPKDALVGSKEG